MPMIQINLFVIIDFCRRGDVCCNKGLVGKTGGAIYPQGGCASH